MGTNEKRGMFLRTAACLLALAAAPAARADPFMEWTVTPVGDGLYAFVFSVNCDDGLSRAIWADMEYRGATEAEKVIQAGQLNQVTSWGQPVDEEPGLQPDIWPPPTDPSYNPNLDCWFYNVLSFCAMVTTEGPNSYYRESGTEPGVGPEVARHAHIVSSGDVVFEGRIARLGVWYPAGGVAPIPEPAALVLLMAAGAAVLRRRAGQS